MGFYRAWQGRENILKYLLVLKRRCIFEMK